MEWHDKSSDEVIKDYSAFLGEFQGETDRGCALVALALMDERLKEILYAFLAETKTSKDLIDGFNAPLGTLSARIKACHSLGLISESEYSNLDTLRRVRNEFAHATHGISFDDPTVSKLCNKITARFTIAGDFPSVEDHQKEVERVFGTPTPRKLFIQAAITLSLHLMYRSRWVALERRVVKDWPYRTENAEQAGTGQPATRPESKSEGGDKPEPEAEGRSR
jgi:mannitol operon repressor